jgi:N4-gp56 family major capsid protein
MPVIDSAYVANTLQPYFEKKLLAKAIQETRLLEYAQQVELPPKHGAKTITFFRPEAANLSAVGAPAVLGEGVPPVARRGISYTPVSATLEQIGQTSETTDIADNIGLFDYVNNAIDLMGEEFALDIETRLRNPLADSITGLTKRYGQGAANFATLAGLTNALGAIVPSDILDAMTRLKLNRAPKINGWYVAYLCPQVTRDVINNQEFREVVRNEHADKIFKGEIGEYYGCKITEGTVPFTEDEIEGTFDDTFDPAGFNTTGLIYTNFVLGKGAYGAVNMKKAGSSLRKPTIIVNDKPDKSDPLNQKIIVGWKAYWKNIILNRAWGIALRTKSQFA